MRNSDEVIKSLLLARKTIIEDARMGYAKATTFTNAPLALIQMGLSSQLDIIERCLGLPHTETPITDEVRLGIEAETAKLLPKDERPLQAGEIQYSDLCASMTVYYSEPQGERCYCTIVEVNEEKKIVKFRDIEDFEWEDKFEDIPTVVRRIISKGK